MIKRFDSVDEHLVLVLSQQGNERLGPVPEYLSFMSYIVAHLWQALFVEIDQVVEGTFSDIQSGKRRQEVVTDKEAKENKVVNYSLQIESDLHCRSNLSVLKQEVFS